MKVKLSKFLLVVVSLNFFQFGNASVVAEDVNSSIYFRNIESIETWDDFFKASIKIRTIPDDVGRIDWEDVRNKKVELSLYLIKRGLEIVGKDFNPSFVPTVRFVLKEHPELFAIMDANEIDDPDVRKAFIQGQDAHALIRKEYSNKMKIIDYVDMHITYLRRFIGRFFPVEEERNLIELNIDQIEEQILWRDSIK